MKDTDEPAFPLVLDLGQRTEWYTGMTLRDYFAAKAMQSILSKWYPVLTEDQDAVRRDTEEIARGAYAMANAMLEARKK